MAPPVRTDNGDAPSWGWLALLLLAVTVYAMGLDGQYIPSNGDEMVYAHIARLTAASQHWLPLVSELENMRNTKPPLLFWQAMVAGNWGQNWQLWVLRAPSLIYTLLITAAIAATVRRLSNDNRSALVAACVYLSFFCTFRYGRPYLTSAAETFWLFGVFFALAWSPARLLASRWKFPLMAGLAIGIGCLYKSFVMVVPIGFALALCYQTVGAQLPVWRIFRRGSVADGVKVAAVCALALAIFGLWFAIDPQPGEVWREFVVGENAGKMNSSKGTSNPPSAAVAAF